MLGVITVLTTSNELNFVEGVTKILLAAKPPLNPLPCLTMVLCTES